jgi:hypothetical protein
MKLSVIAICIIVCSRLSAQNDTIWQVANNVYIKAPRQIKASLSCYCGPDCGTSKESANFIANLFDWETKKHKYRVEIDYSNSSDGSLILMKKANDLEKIPWLKEGMKCEIMERELRGGRLWPIFSKMHFEKILKKGENGRVERKRIKGKYYYLDIQYSEMLSCGKTWAQILDHPNRKPERIVRRFLGIIPYYSYEKGSTYRAEFERYLLVDSILYTFSMITKKRVRKGKAKKQLDKYQPMFNDFVNGIIIREEEEPNED